MDPACGVFAIAYAFTYCLGQHPSEQNYDKQTMRQHLRMCLEKKQIEPFPVLQHALNTATIQELNNSQCGQSLNIKINDAVKATLRKRKQRSDSDKRARENKARHTDKYREIKKQKMKTKRSDSKARKRENFARCTDDYREWKRFQMKKKRSDSKLRKKESSARCTDNYREWSRKEMKKKRRDSKVRKKVLQGAMIIIVNGVESR